MDESMDYDDLTEQDLEVIAMVENDDPALIENWEIFGGSIFHPFERQITTLLHVASYKGCNRIVQALISRGIDVNVRNGILKTPFCLLPNLGIWTPLRD
jgi:ankyrin repeat protein